MVRAIRLSCRFRFVIEKNTQDAIYAHAKELFPAVAIERIIQELEKAHNFQNLPQMLLELHKFGLLASIFPKLSNTSFETVQTHLNPTFAYPKNAPVIAFLLPLFPEASLKEEQAICKSLKLTNLDDSFVSFLHDAKTLAYRDSTSSVEDYDWAHLYASPFAQNALAILAAHNLLSLTHHAQKQQKLQKAVERIRSKTPVVTADFLMSQGVAPGPSMGKLLKAAEKIAINENLDDPTSILKKLL
jgi:poly(A) polymerase